MAERSQPPASRALIRPGLCQGIEISASRPNLPRTIYRTIYNGFAIVPIGVPSELGSLG
jgi:hypothetical protein